MTTKKQWQEDLDQQYTDLQVRAIKQRGLNALNKNYLDMLVDCTKHSNKSVRQIARQKIKEWYDEYLAI